MLTMTMGMKSSRPVALAAFLAIGGAVPAGSQGMLFVAAPPVAVGQGSGQVLFADVNRDGHLDMVTQHLLTRRVVVSFGDGTGKFAAAAGSGMSLGYQPGTITVAT